MTPTETLLLFIALTIFFSMALNTEKRPKKGTTTSLDAEEEDLLEVDDEHRRAIEEFDRLLQGGDTDLVLSAPLRDPKQVSKDFIAGWLRYLKVATYHGEIEWGRYHNPQYNHYDSRYNFKTEVELAGLTYVVYFERGEGSADLGLTEHRLEIHFEGGKKFEGSCPRDLADELFPLARASVRGLVAPSEMEVVMEVLEEKV